MSKPTTVAKTVVGQYRRAWLGTAVAFVLMTATAPITSAASWQEQCVAAGGVYDTFRQGFDLVERCTFYGADGKPVDVQLQQTTGYYRPVIHPGLTDLELHPPPTPDRPPATETGGWIDSGRSFVF